MRYSGFLLNGPKSLSVVKQYRFSVLILILLASSSLWAALPLPAKPDEMRKLIKQAAKLTRAGSFAESEAVLRRAIEFDTKRTEARVELAFVLTKQRRLLDAYDIIYPIVLQEPKNSRAFAVLGATLLTAGRFTEARKVFFNALKLNHSEDLAWEGYGLLDFYENKIGDSIANLQQAVYLEPSEPDYLFALAQVAARAERYKESAEAYRNFLSVSSLTDADRRERIKGLINFLTYLGNTGTLYAASGKLQTTVPFSLVGNRPIINLRINGINEPLRFVLDTGSGISVISDKTAKRLGVKAITHGGFAKGIGGDGKFAIVYGLLKQIAIGEVNLKNVPVYLRKFHDDNQNVDGYIGLALISKFLTTIDYGSQIFSLTKRDSDTQDFRNKSDLSLPLRLTSSGFLSGEVQLEGVESPLNFIVDTGASVSVISDRVAKFGGISPFINDEKLRVVGSAGITENVSTFQLPRVTFGQHSRKDIMAVALDLDIINEASGFEQSGILGGNFLKNYRLTFDFKNSKVTFVSIKPDKDQPE